MNRFVPSLAVLCGALALAGCGGGGGARTATVSGTVTAGGKPLPGGDIKFVPNGAADKTISAAINADGTYKVPGVMYGECKVVVDNSRLKTMMKMPNAPALEGTAGGPGGDQKYVKIDGKYASADTSGLSVTIKSDPTTHNVDLP